MNSKSPVDIDLLLRMYEGREDQINWDKFPPDFNDFPHDVQRAIEAYSKFGSRVDGDLGYLGKDFSLIDQIAENEHVISKGLFLESLIKIDRFYIEKSEKELDAARKKHK